ncbi:MAG: pyridoxamine 5'-phosphate oxidase family protein [Pygmaiobacter sp.]
MRRKDREVGEFGAIMEIVAACKVCRLALVDNGKPYLVPLNFGFETENDILTVYFHSACEGKKLAVLRQNSAACFEVDTEHQLVEHEIPCRNGYLFASAIGSGTVRFLEDAEEKRHALCCIMRHQTGRTVEITDAMLPQVVVFALRVSELSGKRRAT